MMTWQDWRVPGPLPLLWRFIRIRQDSCELADRPEEELEGQRHLLASDLSHRLVTRASLCLSIRPEGPGARLQCEL